MRVVVIGFSSKRRRAAWFLKVLIVVAGGRVLSEMPLVVPACREMAALRAQHSAESSSPGFCLAATTSPRTHLEADSKNNEENEALAEMIKEWRDRASPYGLDGPCRGKFWWSLLCL